MTDTRREQLREFAAALKVGLDPKGDKRVIYADPAEAISADSGYWTKPLNDWAIDHIHFGRNLYFCVGASRKSKSEKDPTKDVWRRRKVDIAAGLMVGLDDIGTKSNVPLEFFLETLPPTVVLETSPGNFQVLYFFSDPIFDPDQFTDTLDSIITPLSEKYGIDPLADITRVLRLPFGTNNKRDELTGFLKYPKDWRVRLVSADYSRRYSPFKIASAYGLTLHARAQIARRIPRTVDGDDDAAKSAAFRLFVNATRKAGGILKPVYTSRGEKYRIACPFGNHASGDGGDSAFIADPEASETGAYTFYCMRSTCIAAHAEGLRTFDMAMHAAGVDIDEINDEGIAAANAEDWFAPPKQ